MTVTNDRSQHRLTSAITSCKETTPPIATPLRAAGGIVSLWQREPRFKTVTCEAMRWTDENSA